MGHQLEACSFSKKQMADRREDVWPFYHQGSGVCVCTRACVCVGREC